MTRTLIAAAAAAALAVPAHTQTSPQADEKAVEAVVRSAYVEGVHAKPSAEAMRKGFHPDFRMYVLREGAVTVVTRDEWAARIEKGAAESKTPPPEIRAEFTRIDVTGNAAVAQVQLYRAGKHVFTDYLSLYRFADGWKIVAKTFQSHR
jgi:hypothetical protein